MKQRTYMGCQSCREIEGDSSYIDGRSQMEDERNGVRRAIKAILSVKVANVT
jgi:hypothetical protein